MPALEIWIASASVPVSRPEASIVCSISSRSAVSQSSSKTLERQRRAPADHRPRAERVAAQLCFSSAPGVSVAWVTSIAERQVGLDRVGAGRRSLQADLLLDRGDRGHPALAARRARGSGAAPPARRRRRAGRPSSARRAAARRASAARRRSPPESPIRTISSARSRSPAPMSMCRPSSSTACFRCSSLSRWIGLAADHAEHRARRGSRGDRAGRRGSAGPSRRSAVK